MHTLVELERIDFAKFPTLELAAKLTPEPYASRAHAQSSPILEPAV
jgi:hypothetical protein